MICSANPVATAGAKALPPRSSTAIPAAEASQCVDATIPKVPRSSGRVVNRTAKDSNGDADRATTPLELHARAPPPSGGWGRHPPPSRSTVPGFDARVCVDFGSNARPTRRAPLRRHDVQPLLPEKSEHELGDAHRLLVPLALDGRGDPGLLAPLDRFDVLDAKAGTHARANGDRRREADAVDAVVHRQPIPTVADELEPQVR